MIPPARALRVDGAAERYQNARAELSDHDLGERVAARPLPIPRVAVGRTGTFQFDGFHRGWVAQFSRDALLATPAFANGKVYVGGGFRSTTVYALDAYTGALHWSGQTADGGPTAAIVDAGKVLFNTESCTLFAFDVASGALRWSHYLGDPLMSQPAAARGLVYSAYPDSSGHGGFSFAAMSMRNGDFVWTLPISADVLTAPVIDGDAVYFTTMDGYAWRVGARSGRVAWARPVSATSAPSVDAGVMYVAQRAAHGRERQLVLDAASGHILSRSDAVTAPYAAHRADVGGTEAGWGFEGSRPSYANGRLYYAMGHDLVAREATTGREVWRRNYPASIAVRGMTSPSVVGGQLVVGTHDGKLFGIDIDTGATTWAYDVGEPIAFQPAIADGWVYAATSRGKVIGLEVGDRSFDGWHMWGGNARHAGLSAHAATSASDEAARPTEGTLRRSGAPTLLRDGDRAFPLMHTRVTARVSGFVARVEVEQDFDNPFDHTLDAEYLFPLPADSAVDGLDLHVGPRNIHGEIALREQARARYESARSCGQHAALLEQQRPDLFRQSVASIGPGEHVRVVLRFAETVPYRDGEYEFVFPLATGARNAETVARGPLRGDVAIHVAMDTGFALDAVTSPSHAVTVLRGDDTHAAVDLASGVTVPDRDFLLRYRPRVHTAEPAVLAWRDEGSPEGVFTFMLHPDAHAAESELTPREVDYVVDTSSSMNGPALEHAQMLLTRSVDRLRAGDTFRIVRFSDTTSALDPAPLPMNEGTRARAHRYIDTLVAVGSTDSIPGLRAVLDAPSDPSRLRIIVLVTDGYLGDDRAVLRVVNASLGRSRLFAVGIGPAVNRYLLEQLADLGRGEASIVTPSEDPVIAADRFAALVDRPFLTDVGLAWGGLAVHDVYPRYVPDLYADRPVLVHGRYDHAGEADVRVTGFIRGHPWQRSVHVVLPGLARDHEALASVWARARVRDLSREMVLGETPALREDIANVGLQYHLVTAFTSFVAVDSEPSGVACSRLPSSGMGLGTVGGYGAGSGHGSSMSYGILGVHGGVALPGVSQANLLARRFVTAPMVRAGLPVVLGMISPDPIRRVVLQNLQQLRTCYERALPRNPSLAGRLVLRFVVGGDGRVIRAEVPESDLDDDRVSVCAVAAARTWVMPAPPDGTSVTVNYPFVFSPADDHEPSETRFEFPLDL